MKKYIFGGLLSCFALCTAQAQTEDQFIRTSIVAGIGASQIDGDEMAAYAKPGFIFGGAARFSISEQLGFQPEVLYFQKGSRTTAEQEEVFGRIHWKVNYVEVPVLLTFTFFPNFTLQGGGAYSYLLGAKADLQGTGFIDRADEFNKGDILWVAGLEYQIWDELSLNLRMERSLLSVKKQPPHFYNNTIGISLRYHLGQGGG